MSATSAEELDLEEAAWLDFLQERRASLLAAAWVESEHPRHPEGSEEGGRFAPKHANSPLTPQDREVLRGYREGLRLANGFSWSDQTHLSGHFMNKMLREGLNDEQAADWLIRNAWGVGKSKATAPVYLEKLPRAKQAVATARANTGRLDDMIEGSEILEDHTVYRGMTNPGAIFGYAGTKQFEENLDRLVGRTFTDPGFTATTFDENVARKGFAKAWYNDGWVLRWQVPAGTPGLVIDEKELGIKSGLKDYPSESEILLGRNHKFKITGIDKDTRTIDLEMTA